LPAGDYIVSPTSTNRKVLRFQHKDSDRQVMGITIAAHAGTAAVQPKLVFRRYDDQYFLSQVWMTSGPTGNELPAAKSERILAKAGPPPQWLSVLPKGPETDEAPSGRR